MHLHGRSLSQERTHLALVLIGNLAAFAPAALIPPSGEDLITLESEHPNWDARLRAAARTFSEVEIE